MKIAIAQGNAVVGDIGANIARLTEMAQEATGKGASLVVFPELFLCGYPPEDLLFSSAFLDAVEAGLREVCTISANLGVTLVVGAPQREEGKLYNGAFVFQKGVSLPPYKKIALPNYGVFDECRYFTHGPQNQPESLFRHEEKTIGLTVCEDIWGYSPENFAPLRQCDLIVNVSSSPFHIDKGKLRQEAASHFAASFNKPLLYANLVGGQDELVFDGGSLAFDEKGECTRRFPSFVEGVFIVDFPLEAATPAPEKSREDAIRSALCLGLKDYVRKTGFSTVVLGLSGGIDSALTAALAAEALGSENVKGVLMPSRFSSEGSIDDSLKLAKKIGIETFTLPIESVNEAFLSLLSPPFSGKAPDVTEENLQARIRGVLLMAFSNKFGWLLLSTGNKSEVSVGYCTLYGDMCGGYSLLKDLYKTDVYRLSSFLNEEAKKEIIPKEIIEKAPSAELRENQKDSDSLPEYDLLDKILYAYIEERKSVAEIGKEICDPAIAKRIAALVDRNEYKRRQASPGVKLSPLAFGKDRRIPISNRFRQE